MRSASAIASQLSGMQGLDWRRASPPPLRHLVGKVIFQAAKSLSDLTKILRKRRARRQRSICIQCIGEFQNDFLKSHYRNWRATGA